MTSAAIPALRHQPEIYAEIAPKIMSTEYDPRNVPLEQKTTMGVGMAMTEKQGGSDVRANSTRAVAVGDGGPGQEYQLIGHKYFVSAPMCDAFLVLAQSDAGLSCFYMPRWRPDGSRNAMQIQKLKNKMGNVANASSETELRGAYALMVGEEARGVRTIIDMVAMTRFDCMIGSSAGMRQALGKYWICKRVPGHACEAMECIGGSGVMEDCIMPRLFRESPVNAIWEGSGNIQCLDLLRALDKEPAVLDTYFSEVDAALGSNTAFDAAVDRLKKGFADASHFEYRARSIIGSMARVLQASVLLQHAPSFVSQSFCISRLGAEGAHLYGTLPVRIDCDAIVERALPAL